MSEIDTADIVQHVPSREIWMVAYVDGDKICPCGWPMSLAEVTDCRLVRKATWEAREGLLVGMSSLKNDPRGEHARKRLTPEGAAS